MTKVILVQPYYENIWEPIGLGFIASYLKKHFVGELDLQCFQGNFDTDETIIENCVDADVVGFSCTSPAWPHALRLAEEIKKKNSKVRTVFGGFHPSAIPDECVAYPQVDQVVIGEGEEVFLDIVNGNTDPIVQGTKPPMQDLPWPDRKIIKNHRTVGLCESMNGLRIASFQCNRVCPVNCAFCAERIITGRFNKRNNPIRSRDVSDLCDEIEHVIEELDINYFKFVDATFDISAKFVIEFCKEKIKRGITCEWECLIHASFASEEMFKWLKDAQCHQVNIGCESGSDKILREIGKGLQVRTIKNVFSWAKKYGVERRGFFLFGMPNETRADLYLTEQLIDEIRPDVVGFTLLCPYPGTALYDPELHKDVDWELADEYSNDFWCTEHFTNIELKAQQSYFKTKYDLLLCERLADTSQFGGFGDMRDEEVTNTDLEKRTTSTPIGANVNNLVKQ
jgi:anaerobic magnesium-protoporphyrin IX monomethyl ester cyclase